MRISKISGNSPFLAYGVINDGGVPGERSGDGAYLLASVCQKTSQLSESKWSVPICLVAKIHHIW